MNLKDVIRIIRRNLWMLILFPVMLAVLVNHFTKQQPREYTSSVLIYTGVGSGFKITTDDKPHFDHNAVNNTFDNLVVTLHSRETIEEVALRLLATHLMLNEPDPFYISNDNFERLQEIFPEDERKKIVVENSREKTLANLRSNFHSTKDNKVKAVLDSDDEIYSIDYLKEIIESERKEFSDMLDIWITTNDPGVSYTTLNILTDIFLDKYQDLKLKEIRNVVSYFTDQVEIKKNRLKYAEDKLRKFGVDNKIVNYEEQAKSVSAAREELNAAIQKEEMVYSSAEASVKKLDEKIDLRKGLLETNEKISTKRKELSEVNYQIANSGLYNDDDEKKSNLDKKAKKLKNEIQGLVNDLYVLNNSQEGLPKDGMLEQWLEQILIMDESKARLLVLNKKIKEYDDRLNALAPLKATLNGLEREVDIAEEDYLQALKALNTNKERQQNIEMATNARVVDKAYFPVKPDSSKRMMVVLASFFGGITLIGSVLVGRELLDNRIITPRKAEKQTGLTLAGVVPFLPSNRKSQYLSYAEESLMDQTLSSVMLGLQETAPDKAQKTIMICSTRAGEGKTRSTLKFANKLSEIDGPVLLLHPEEEDGEGDLMNENRQVDITTLDLRTYKQGKDFIRSADPAAYAGVNKEDREKYRYLIIEVPPLVENQLPLSIIKGADLTLLVVDASREWTDTDNYINGLLKKASGKDPMLLLNKVPAERLEEILGGIPRRHRKTKKVKKIKPGKNEEVRKERL
ncbi:hypothetical protein RCC89_08535 [Cytophagaceae bacterium ABcell3]|nr:hypothetical protein RCC89_08535 [Cytophagaceae bacterium ABcell3]